MQMLRLSLRLRHSILFGVLSVLAHMLGRGSVNKTPDASTSASSTGGAPVGHFFSCGDKTCNTATQYCVHHWFQGGCPAMEFDTCEEYPSACGSTPSGKCVFSDGCMLWEGDTPCSDRDGEVRCCHYEIC